MEMNLIFGIIGFIAGGILVHFMNSRITSFDASLHAKVDSLLILLHIMKATSPAVAVAPAPTTTATTTTTAPSNTVGA